MELSNFRKIETEKIDDNERFTLSFEYITSHYGSDEELGKQYFEKALEYAKDKRFNLAELFYRKSLLAKINAVALGNLSSLLDVQKRYAEAVKWNCKAIDEDISSRANMLFDLKYEQHILKLAENIRAEIVNDPDYIQGNLDKFAATVIKRTLRSSEGPTRYRQVLLMFALLYIVKNCFESQDFPEIAQILAKFSDDECDMACNEADIHIEAKERQTLDSILVCFDFDAMKRLIAAIIHHIYTHELNN